MVRSAIVVTLAAFGSVVGVLSAAPGQAQVTAPADFTIPKGENSPGGVTFSHARHRAKVEKCSTCHMQDFKLKRGASGPITLAAKQEGRFCGACHDGKTQMGGVVVFPVDQCDSCHKD
jgi:c(7)-type cytochrome triheme protein